MVETDLGLYHVPAEKAGVLGGHRVKGRGAAAGQEKGK
jgi:hypothetical protein